MQSSWITNLRETHHHKCLPKKAKFTAHVHAKQHNVTTQNPKDAALVRFFMPCVTLLLVALVTNLLSKSRDSWAS